MKEELGILVVSSDREARRRLVTTLRSVHPNVVQAKSSEEAVGLFHSFRPAIVFADVTLSTGDGKERQRIACADEPAVVESILSGNLEDHIVLDSLKTKASEVLQKPITAKRLKELLTRLSLVAERKKKASFEPGTISRAELDFELNSRSEVIAPTVKMILGIAGVFVEPGRLTHFELAIDEALRNAYEHGNLGISNEEKCELCEANMLEKTLKEREIQATQAGKSIHVNVKCSPEEFCCVIEDQGEGFDWRDVPNPTDSIDALTSLHGRGLMLIRNVFDTVAFNEKGNKVTLIKKLGT